MEEERTIANESPIPPLASFGGGAVYAKHAVFT